MTGRVVIKVGSRVLTRKDGTIDITRMSSLVDQIAELRRSGKEVILVSSGAVACGRSMLKVSKKLDSVDQRQLFSAIGQVRLINLYYQLFRDHGIRIGQVLTMKESFSTRREYLNQRNCMEVMLRSDVLPIVNENDTVSVTELMFTDNDELSSLIASMMDAETLILLSSVDGIYDGPPSDPESRVIPEVSVDADLSRYIQEEKSSLGRGGMSSKFSSARNAALEGIEVIIANGTRDDILTTLTERPEQIPHTRFLPAAGVSRVKKWIAHSGGFAKGGVRVNADAAKALRGPDAVSLLLVGVTSVDGDFEEGDIIPILDEEGVRIALGKSGYSSSEARKLLGVRNRKPLVHYNYLFMEGKKDG